MTAVAGPAHAPTLRGRRVARRLALGHGDRRLQAGGRAGRRRAAAGSPQRRRRQPAMTDQSGRDPLRLRRDPGRAQRRQVDPAQPPGRHQGVDREPQGPDHPPADSRASRSRGAAQLVFVDTPGIFTPAPGRRLERAMVQAAWRSAEDADRRVLVVDARRGLDRDTRMILDGLGKAQAPADAGDQQDRPGQAADGAAADRAARIETGLFERVFIVSALTGDGCEDLLECAGRGSAGRARGCSPRISCPICRSAPWPPRSPASSCSSSCTRSCLTA